jgi:tRNASer (uridine44-2'-O)-methyltransferase
MDSTINPVLQVVNLEIKTAEGMASSIESVSREPLPFKTQMEEMLPEKSNGQRFEPRNVRDLPEGATRIDPGLPSEIWVAILDSPAVFPPRYFLTVAKNLLKNPNITSSHLFRAEIFYDSQNDASFDASATSAENLSCFIRHMRPDYKPRMVARGIPGYQLVSTVVRKMIPRNPQLDKPLVQTCHLFTSTKPAQIRAITQSNSEDSAADETGVEERHLMIWIPHVDSPDDVPWYHPPIRALATLYSWRTKPALGFPPGNLSLYYDLFPGSEITTRMERTALNLLKIIHKHAQGQMEGYTKRVHHDIILSQKQFQDTYTYLKAKYAKILIRDWVEQTPPTKNVFEDLGIAAFLIELWTEMYGIPSRPNALKKTSGMSASHTFKDDDSNPSPNGPSKYDDMTYDHDLKATAQDNFPGFVDIGCGNGLLVNVLLKEGWSGWGFDARYRKSWGTYTSDVQNKLKELLLVPKMFQTSSSLGDPAPPFHDGIFAAGTFIVANHADQLTGWTPLLAALSQSPFIVIPCCSHNFAGARFRAPAFAVTRPGKSTKPPSAYAALCGWMEHLTADVGYVVEKEMLRIPSTRNAAILGRRWTSSDNAENMVRTVVEREMGVSVEAVGREWVAMTKKFWEKGSEKDH